MTLSQEGINYICINFGSSNCCVASGLSWYYTRESQNYPENGGTAQIVARLASGLVDSLTMTNPATGTFTQTELNNANGSTVTIQDAQTIAQHDEPSEDQWCYSVEQEGIANVYDLLSNPAAPDAGQPLWLGWKVKNDGIEPDDFWFKLYINSILAWPYDNFELDAGEFGNWGWEVPDGFQEDATIKVEAGHWEGIPYQGGIQVLDDTEEIIIPIGALACADYLNQAECVAAGCYWWNGSCHDNSPTCSQINNSTDCGIYGCYWWGIPATCHSYPEPPPNCDDYLNQVDCEAAGCFWYDESCHSTPPGGLPDWWWMPVVGAVAVIGVAAAVIVYKKK